ncbi:hypothetical protein SDRG_00887 [Saprolegnia diclina VS20]|uniref:Uncharacterized protein n=1 Tax=Saprolegnia diclina (strain VS20) TaxID=1156394 RepID=T0QV17_SAPDV|nr:hypothetical protein SDRG_00887 [Saprolegnia diclina VS20]EQC42044.1 hypothetical protein SDRG_00887 [Saprolegnia diclina VS20]|eukprot:XP_008604613.1 hypothetical protein SDRG_00887 [Saprolegnia diclina VS20]
MEAVIFDLDGTLLDTEMLSVAALTQICGSGYNMELQKRIMGTPAHQWTRVVIEAMGLSLTPDELTHEWHVVMKAKYNDAVILPGALELLAKLPSHIKIALATSSPASAVAVKRAVHPTLFERFQVIVTGDHPAVRNGKPSPDIFLEAARQLGVHDVSKCIVVEDTMHGVTAGKAAGMRVVAVPDARFYATADYPGRFDHADVILPSLLAWDMEILNRC